MPFPRTIFNARVQQICFSRSYQTRSRALPFQRRNLPSLRRAASTTIYRPLDKAQNEIRVLRVHPGKESDEVSCELEVVSLDYRPRYDTLSYTWGDPSRTALITVNTLPVHVSINLFQALKALRSTWQVATVWADALCINQQNNDEKNTQVTMMGRIYRQGKQTWISLGSPDYDWAWGRWAPESRLEERMALIPRMVRSVWRLIWHHLFLRRSRKSRLGVNHVSDTLRLLRSLESRDRDDLDVRQQDDEKMARSMLTWIISHEYWTRVWIMQEVALSNHDPICVFGNHQIPLLSLDTIMSDWRGGGFTLPAGGQDIVGRTTWSSDMTNKLERATTICMLRDQFRVWSRIFRRKYHLDLIHCLELGSRGRASHPVDHVYGLHSILSPEDQKQLPPDYTLSPRELYSSATKLILRRKMTASILCAAIGIREENQHMLPSWVLDFSQPLKSPVSRADIEAPNFAYEARSSGHDSLSINSRDLEDYVVAVQDDGSGFQSNFKELDLTSSDPKHFEEQIGSLIRHFLNPTVRSDQTLDVEAFFHVLTARVYEEAEHSSSNKTLYPLSDEITKGSLLSVDLVKRYREIGYSLQSLWRGHLAGRHTWDQDMADMSSRFSEMLLLLLSEQTAFPELFSGRLFYTRKGLVGKCSREVELYDEIWELPGSKTPFLLRPSKNLEPLDTDIQRTTTYQLVGPCVYSNMSPTREGVSIGTVKDIKIV